MQYGVMGAGYQGSGCRPSGHHIVPYYVLIFSIYSHEMDSIGTVVATCPSISTAGLYTVQGLLNATRHSSMAGGCHSLVRVVCYVMHRRPGHLELYIQIVHELFRKRKSRVDESAYILG